MKNQKFNVGALIKDVTGQHIRFIYKTTGKYYYLMRMEDASTTKFTKYYINTWYKEMKQNDDS